VYGEVPPDAPVSFERSEVWPWLMVVGDADIVGALISEMTVTVGWSPSKVSFTPPPSLFEVAAVVHVVTPEEERETASKVNMTLVPLGITEVGEVAVRVIVVVDRV
jgi:hypothetical protein